MGALLYFFAVLFFVLGLMAQYMHGLTAGTSGCVLLAASMICIAGGAICGRLDDLIKQGREAAELNSFKAGAEKR